MHHIHRFPVFHIFHRFFFNIPTFQAPNSSLPLLLPWITSWSIFCFLLHVKYFVNINNGGYSRRIFSFHNNMHRPPHFHGFIQKQSIWLVILVVGLRIILPRPRHCGEACYIVSGLLFSFPEKICSRTYSIVLARCLWSLFLTFAKIMKL